MSVTEPNDNIDYLVTIPRKQTRSAEKVDSSQVMMMKERLLQTTMNYEQDKYANELMIGDKRLAMSRQREDLDWAYNTTLTSTILSAGMAVAGAGVGLATGGLTAAAAAGASLKGFASAKGGIEFLIRHPTLMRRINEDESNMLMANTQQLYQRRQNYEHDFKFQTIKLNKIAGSYQKPVTTNRDAQEQYNKEREVGDIHLEIYLPSQTQKKQIDYIYSTFGCECVSEHFKESPLEIRNGMEPGLYRFSRIEKDGIITSITDGTIKTILKQILENGVKFESCKIEVVPHTQREIHIAIPELPKVVFDPENTKDWPKEKWDLYKFKTEDKKIIDALKKVPHYGLTDEEWEANKDKFKDIDDKTLLDYLDKIISGREPGKTIIISIPRETDPEKERLNEIINNLRNQITNLENQIRDNTLRTNREKNQLEDEKRDLESKLTQCRQQHTDISKEKEGKEGEIKVIQGTVTALELEKQQLQNQLNECKAQINRLVAAQEACDKINTAEIKRLKAEIDRYKKQLERDKNTLQTITQRLITTLQNLSKARSDLQQCNVNLNNKNREIATIQEQLTQKQTQIDELLKDTKTTEELERLKGELEREKETATAVMVQLANKTKELNQLKQTCDNQKIELEGALKRLSDEIKQHKIDKEDLGQQLNDQRRRAIIEKAEIDRLKKQIEDSKGDRDKIAELEQKIQELELEKATVGDQIAAKQRELEQCKTELNLAKLGTRGMAQIQTALTRCLNNVKNKEAEIETLKQQLNQKETQIQGLLEGVKNREELEQLEQQLRNKTAEYEKLQEQIRQCQSQLDQTKKTPPKKYDVPKIADECGLIKTMLHEPYNYDIKSRENGWNAFLDLVFELAQVLRWEGKTQLDQKLGNIQQMGGLLERLEELKNVPIVDRAIDTMNEPG